MSPAAHAKLSPSSSDRWLSCPASVRAIAEHAPADEGSVYAREGTIAHALGELRAGLAYGLIKPQDYHKQLKAWEKEFAAENYEEGTREEMWNHVTGYVNFIGERLKRVPGSVLLLEQRLDSGIPGCWGTSDAVIFSTEHVEIVDLKYGAGVRVSAIENSQLRIYGLGALDEYGDILGDTERVYVTVYQPRVDNVSTEELTADELRQWREETARPGAEATKDPDAPFGPSEKACRWCPLAGTCMARIRKATMEDFGDILAEELPQPEDPEVLTPEQIGLALKRVPEIKAWAAALEAAALEMAYGRQEQIPGWKVVMSGGKRSITDHAAAVQTLIDAGHPAEKVADFKAKALGTLEKLVGKKELPELLGDLIQKSKGRESLVPEDDPRPAISPASEAAADFAESEAA